MLVRRLIEEKLLVAKVQEYQEGNLLFSAGDKPDKLYYLVQGDICLFSALPGQPLQSASPGALVGLADILNEEHTQTALVVKPSMLQVIDRDKLLLLIEQNPALRVYFLRLLSQGLSSLQPVFE